MNKEEITKLIKESKNSNEPIVLPDDLLEQVSGGASDESVDFLLEAMEGVVVVDSATMAQIRNLTNGQIGTLFIGLLSNMFGKEFSKEHRYNNFISHLQSFGVSTAGCSRAF